MAYPMPLQYDDERIERRDFEYMKSMYPITVKEILPYVESECDRMSYEGSMIYDEYPDRITLYKLATDITESIVRDKQMQENVDKEHIGMIVQILLMFYHY